jgi:hypothetical protein
MDLSTVRKKLLTSQVQSTALANPAQLGYDIPEGMKMYIVSLQAVSIGAVTTLNVYRGDAVDPDRDMMFEGLTVLPNNALGGIDCKLEGTMENPIAVVEPQKAALVYTYNRVYVGDGGVRVECTMTYFYDY